ncbi:MAG: DinB family protein [Planctomycetes bacterium]|nr:DinB family protein [Planctomycetota bacterium]
MASPTPAPLSPTELSSLITRYESLAGLAHAFLADLTPAQLLARPADGSWTIHENVIHLWDSDVQGSDRMKRVASMETPLLMNYDETSFVRALSYHAQSATLAADGFAINRQLTAQFLRGLAPESFARHGVHSLTGVKTLVMLVSGYIGHVEHHAAVVSRKRVALGAKPLDQMWLKQG